MTPAELRRRHRAARSIAHLQRLEPRALEAAAVLAAALGDADRASVPGYTVIREGDAVRVAAVPRVDAAQLVLGLDAA